MLAQITSILHTLATPCEDLAWQCSSMMMDEDGSEDISNGVFCMPISKSRKEGIREPNGRLSRKREIRNTRVLDGLDKEQREILGTGLLARQRVLGVSRRDIRSQEAGSYIGRLRLQNSISQPQYEAATLFNLQHHDYLIAIAAPRQPGAVDLNATKGGSTDREDEDRTRKLRATYEMALAALSNAILEPSNRGCKLYGAAYACIFQDQENDTMLTDLRTALNVLVRHYGKLVQSKAA